MNIDKTKIAYVVGIDLGHGETSAAFCPLQWDAEEAQWENPTDIEMENNRKVIPSAITLLPDGRAFIGAKAFEPDILKKAEVHVCFKKKPENIDGEAERLMTRFMEEVYKLIRTNTSGILTDDNHVVYIATPSGWDKAAQDLYLQMAEKAGLPMAGITKESRAAFVRGLHNPASGLSQNTRNGGIVFDMGSSTLDFTYMNNSKNDELIDYGYNCGASFIEKYLYQKKHEEGNIEEFEEKYPELQNCLVYAARQVKEEVYFKPGMKVRKTIHLDEVVEDDELDETVKFVFQPGELNQMLEDAGYVKQIEDAMIDFVANHIDNAPIYGVFLTGGASRMDFIKPAVAKCFHLDESAIARDQDPSLTISQGVAEVARMDLRTEGADESLDDMIDELTQDDRIYDTFVESYAHDLWDKMTENIGYSLNEYGNSNKDSSLNSLNDRIDQSVSKAIEEYSNQVGEYIGNAIDSNMEEIKKMVENIVAVYSNQGLKVSMPKINAKANIKMDSNMLGVIDNIRDTIASQSTDWKGTIMSGTIGGVLATLFAGPLGWILGGSAIYFGRHVFGSSEEEKKAKAMSKKLDADKRVEVVNSIYENWDDITSKLESTIYEEVSKNTQLKNNIKKATEELLNAYKKELKDARILVD